MKKFVLCIIALLLLSGCITSQTMPLAPNMVRIDTQAGGLLFAGQTVPATMKAAATATLNAGYSHFRLSEASTGVGDRYAGTTCGGGSNFATCTNIRAPTSQAGVTVTMFHANEPGAKGAFEAQQILAQYQ
jgi:hypothetical protein